MTPAPDHIARADAALQRLDFDAADEALAAAETWNADRLHGIRMARVSILLLRSRREEAEALAAAWPAPTAEAAREAIAAHRAKWSKPHDPA